MAKKERFKDPLEDIDPIMEQAFSIGGEESEPAQPTAMESEKKAAPQAARPEVAPSISEIQFPDLSQEAPGQKMELDLFHNIPVNLSVELGRSQISLKEVYELTEGSIIELERLVGEPLDLVVNGQVIAQGEVVAIDNNYGLRITTIVASPAKQ